MFKFKSLFLFLLSLSLFTACEKEDFSSKIEAEALEVNSLEGIFSQAIAIYQREKQVPNFERSIAEISQERDALIHAQIEEEEHYAYPLYNTRLLRDYLCAGGICPCGDGNGGGGGKNYYFVTPGKTKVKNAVSSTYEDKGALAPLFQKLSLYNGRVQQNLKAEPVQIAGKDYVLYTINEEEHAALLSNADTKLRFYISDPLSQELKTVDFKIALEEDAHNGLVIKY